MDIAICEDIPQHADRLAKMIEKYYVGKDKPIIYKFEHCGIFLDSFRNREQDFIAIFLDIRMPGINGLEAAKHIRFSDESVPIVFITSAQEYATDGYQYDAVSFLIKPVGEELLFKTLNRIEKRRSSANMPSIMITSDGYVYRVLLSKITSIERVGRKTIIYRAQDKAICTSQSFDDLFENLKSIHHFMLVYQSNYINLQHVVNIDKKHKVATLSDGRVIPIGRDRLQPFLKMMLSFLGEV